MDIRATAKIKISPTPEIVQTLKVWKKALQFCVNTAWETKIRNYVKLQPFVYKKIRGMGLQSQLAIACIHQACGMVKKTKTKPIIKKISMRYNFPRSASFKNNILSLATIKGRVKIPFSIPECYKDYFTWDIKESLLRIDKKGRCFFMFVFAKEVDIKDSDVQSFLGVDLGINTLAVTSNNVFFNAQHIKKVKRKYQFLRSKLQAKGTKSAKRRLKSLSGKERRFMAWVNHNVSKSIVSNCKVDCIRVENLKGIRKQRIGKTMNRWLNKWSFYQLQSFIEYKANREGIGFQKVKAYLTSQVCSKCEQIGTRSKGFFHCQHCSFSLNSDLNASRNIAKGTSYSLPAVVNQPDIPQSSAGISYDESKNVKPSTSVVG